MEILIALPLLGGLAAFQSAVLSRIPLLMGTADILLLTIIAWSIQDQVKTAWHWSVIGGFLASLASAIPFGVLILSYLIITGIARVVRRYIWKIPLLAMFLMTFLGTVIIQVASLLSRLLSGMTIPIIDAINLILIPTIILNVLLTIPIYIVITDMAGWLYREEIKA
jgi:cell shape-determining protein MreD